jgi:hypothetical protein
VSKIVADMLMPSGYLLGNFPIASWEYALRLTDQGNAQYGNIRKFCGVSFTVGDKRAESHLLTGIEVLLALSFGDSEQSVNVDSVFPLTRFKDGRIVPTWKSARGDESMIDGRVALNKIEGYMDWEASNFVRHFRGALGAFGYSWGLFFDHTRCEPHCNASRNLGRKRPAINGR